MILLSTRTKFMIKKKKKLPPVLPPFEKDNFPSFMRKEIFVQGDLINHFLNKYIKAQKIRFNFIKVKIDRIKRAYIIGNAADYCVALAGAYNFEVLADVPCNAELISEFNCSNPILDKSTLVIVISHSPNDLHTKIALDRIRHSGCKVIGIFDFCPPDDWTISLDFESKSNILTASTTLRHVALTLLSLYFGNENEVITPLYVQIAVQMLQSLDERIKNILSNEYFIRQKAMEMINRDILFSGANVDFASSVYGAYLMNGVNDNHIQIIPAGELENCFIKPNQYTVAFASNKDFYNMLNKNIHFDTIILPASIMEVGENRFVYPESIPLLNPILSGVCLQLTAYQTALIKGKDIL